MNSYSPVWRVDLQLRPSRSFLALAYLLHAGALLAAIQSGLGPAGKIFLALCLMISLVLSWRHEKARAGIVVKERGQEWWLGISGSEMPAELLGRQVWRYLVVMDFQCFDGKRRRRQRIVVLPDAVPADVFRRLQVRLRYGRALRRAQPALPE